MNNILSGQLYYNNKKYSFVLDGRIVRVIDEPIQYMDNSFNFHEIEIIKGYTSDKKDIQFLHCKFPKTDFGFSSSFSIQGYALSYNNIDNPCDFTYNCSSFESDAINTFFSPQKAVNMDMDMDIGAWDGKIDIKVSPFKDTDLHFNYLETKCWLRISRYVRIGKDPTSIGQVKSIFTFEHPQPQSLTKIVDDYLALYDFLSFTNYNSNISFNSIYISKKENNGHFNKTATVHIFSDKTEYENTSWNSITIDDIPSEKLSDIFTHVASLRGKDSRLRFYFPENANEGRYIDPGKWLIMALNFEGLFSTKFPNFKCNINNYFRNAKELALERLDNNSDGKSLSKKEKKYYKKCREQIERYEGELEEKFNYFFNANKTVLDSILKYNKNHFGVEVSNNYGKNYADYRNKIAHGSVEPLSDKEVAIYRVLLPLIYLLILLEIDLSDDEKKKIVEKLLKR